VKDLIHISESDMNALQPHRVDALAISRLKIKKRWLVSNTAVQTSTRRREDTSRTRHPIKDCIKVTLTKSAVRDGGAKMKRRRESGEGAKSKGHEGFRPGNVIKS
jgi:hypothetical protein